MSELRYYGFKIQVENADGQTKVQQFRKAVTDLDDTVEMLNGTLGDNVSVTANTVQGEKEAVLQAKLLTAQYEKQRQKTQDVLDQYTQLNSTIKTYGNDLETVTALTRLGSNATDEQKQQVVNLINEYKLLRKEGDAGRTSFRNLRGAAQNLSWQLQDVAVQAQMGTSWITILTQQGSQAASVFGVYGAAVGAAIAIIGSGLPVLISSLSNSTVSTDKLKTASSNLNDILSVTDYTVTGVTTKLTSLYKIDSQLAQLKLVGAVADAKTALQGYNQQITDTLKNLAFQVTNFQGLQKNGQSILDSLLPTNQAAFTSYMKDSAADFEKLAKSYGLSVDQLIELNDAYNKFKTTGDTTSLTKIFTDLTKNSKSLSPELAKLVSNYADLAAKGELATAQLKELQDITSGVKTVTGESASATQTAAEKYAQMTRQLTMTDEQKAIDNYLTGEGSKQSDTVRQKTERLISAYYSEKAAIAARNEMAKQTTTNADAAYKAREKLLVQIEKQIRRNAVLSNSGNAILKEEERHNDVLEKIYEARKDMYQGDYETKMRLDKMTESENETHNQNMENAELEFASNWSDILGSTASLLTTLADEFAEGSDDVKDAISDMDDFQKAAYFVTRAAAAASALVNGMDLGMKLASATGIPSMYAVGTALGASAAGAIMGTTFAGYFDEGGNIPAGQSGIVSEYSDELVNGVLVKGPANVVGSNDTARIMDGSTSSTSVSSGQNITQNITVAGNGDAVLVSAMKKAALMGAKQGYAAVANDFATGRGIRKTLKNSIGA